MVFALPISEVECHSQRLPVESESIVNDKVSPQHPFVLLQQLDSRNRQRVTAQTPGQAHSLLPQGQLAVQVGPWNLLFSMDDVTEIIPLPRITQVPGVKSWLLGIANLRGTVISAVDLCQFFNGRVTVPTPSSRLIIVVCGEWTYGLLVDEVIGMRHFSVASRLSDLEVIETELRPYLTEGFEVEQQRWLAFNVVYLLNQPQFLNAAT